MPTASSIIVVVLIASTMVAAALAFQAVAAARRGRAISEAMLRQYAELAAWEFSRQARRSIDESLMQALVGYAHPECGSAGVACQCAPLDGIEHWFDVKADGSVTSRSGSLPGEIVKALDAIRLPTPHGASEATLSVFVLPDDATRFVALKPEPHLAGGGGHVGLVARTTALGPALARTHRTSALLPPQLAAGHDARAIVDLRIVDGAGTTVFASAGTMPGPYAVETPFVPGTTLALTARAAMTPGFVADLGPEHGAPQGIAVVVTLVVVNALLVGVGLRQLARERELARLRDDFVAGVSHELRTPLAQIRMFTDTLLLDRVRNPAESRRAIEIIGQEAHRLSQLADNVLYFHRHRRAPAGGPSELIELNELMQDVIDSFAPLAASKRVSLHLAVHDDGLLVRGHVGALRQVLLNLLDNAVKFGPAGQTVTISVASAHDRAVLTVDDQGDGVPPGERVRVFRAFERGGNTHGTGGAGIGLAIVGQIVATHGGSVSVDEAPGGGARFAVSLPVVDRQVHVELAQAATR